MISNLQILKDYGQDHIGRIRLVLKLSKRSITNISVRKPQKILSQVLIKKDKHECC